MTDTCERPRRRDPLHRRRRPGHRSGQPLLAGGGASAHRQPHPSRARLGRTRRRSGPAASFDPAPLIAQGFGPLVVGVRGRNVGGLAVDITHRDIYTGDGFGYTLPGYPLNPNLPHRLEPGSTVTFLCPIEHVRALITSKATIGKTDQRIRGALSLRTGDVCKTDLLSLASR